MGKKCVTLHSTGICLTIPSQEIRKTRFQTNRGFADCVELGGNFPNLHFTIRSMKTYKPLWLDAAPPRKISPALAKKMDGGPVPENRDNAEGDSQPDYPVAPPRSRSRSRPSSRLFSRTPAAADMEGKQRLAVFDFGR